LSLKVIICAIHEVERLVMERGVDEVLSVMPQAESSPGWLAWPDVPVPRTVVGVSDIGYGGFVEHDELRIIAACHPDVVVPAQEHVRAILAVGGRAIERGRAGEWTLLCHCQSGLSRSVAAAFLVMALEDGPGREAASWERLRRIAGHDATPNHNLVFLGDAELGRDGELYAAMAMAATAGMSSPSRAR
jgi:predicted protein tyrosine phosphatase